MIPQYTEAVESSSEGWCFLIKHIYFQTPHISDDLEQDTWLIHPVMSLTCKEIILTHLRKLSWGFNEIVHEKSLPYNEHQ